MMLHVVFGAAFCFAFLTLWIPAEWPVTVFQLSGFAVAAAVLIRPRTKSSLLSYPFFALTAAVLFGCFELWTGATASNFNTKNQTVAWATLWAVFVAGHNLFS